MVLFLASLSFPPCHLSGYELQFDLVHAMARDFDVATVVVTYPDPWFGDDKPITFTLEPATGRNLTFTTSYTVASALSAEAEVDEYRIVDRVIVTPTGLLLGSGTCEARLSQATMLLEAIDEI